MAHLPAAFVHERFPLLSAVCREAGFDLAVDRIPVAPAAHYVMGGVVTDLDGRTTLPGLFAAGEAACTGVHGANRLASNSLLECLVFAKAAAEDIIAHLKEPDADSLPLPPWDESRVTDPDEQVVVSHNWDELRRFMWDYVGIVRTTKRLQRAQHRVNLLREEIREYYTNFRVGNDLIELRNLVLVAELIIQCALARAESRGLHYTRDYPRPDPRFEQKDTVLTPPRFAVATARARA